MSKRIEIEDDVTVLNCRRVVVSGCRTIFVSECDDVEVVQCSNLKMRGQNVLSFDGAERAWLRVEPKKQEG